MHEIHAHGGHCSSVGPGVGPAIGMVESMRIKAFVLDYRVPFDQWPGAIAQAYDYCRMTSRPIVVFLNLKD